MKLSNASFTFYEFFAGAGLVRLALEPEWECVWANDIDPRKGAVYIENFGRRQLVLGDVAEVDATSLPPGVDMAWASFPCQDLSLAGWRRGMSAERSGAFWPFWRLMRDLHDRGERPRLVVLENVLGLLHSSDFVGMCEALAALGLQFGVLVLDARWFLPQSRPRVFVVAMDSAVDCRRFTTSLPKGCPWFPESLRAAYGKMPRALRELWRWWVLPIPEPPPVTVEDLIEDEPAGVEWHTREETERLLDMMSSANLKKIHQAQNCSKVRIGFLYKRTRSGVQRAEVRFDGTAGCLRTPQGGSSRQTVVVVHGAEIRSRLLSPREAARLMGAPDSFILPEGYNDAYRAMGDGVAVPVVSWLSEHLLIPLVRRDDDGDARLRGVGSEIALASRETAEALATQWEISRR